MDRRTRCYLCYVHQCATGFILTLLHRRCQRATAQVFPTGTGITRGIHKSNKTRSHSSHPPPALLQPSPQTANDVASIGGPQPPPPANQVQEDPASSHRGYIAKRDVDRPLKGDAERHTVIELFADQRLCLLTTTLPPTAHYDSPTHSEGLPMSPSTTSSRNISTIGLLAAHRGAYSFSPTTSPTPLSLGR